MMVEKVDIAETLKDRPFFKGRTPHNDDEAEAAFAVLGETDIGGIYAGSWEGKSAWEVHPNGDELVHVLEGETTMTLLTSDEGEQVTLTAGQIVVVPAGVWHRFDTPEGVTVMTSTPTPTEHSTADDPRKG